MKDKCIMCGKETQYDVSTHIDLRTIMLKVRDNYVMIALVVNQLKKTQ
jgi:hypothetical protein